MQKQIGNTTIEVNEEGFMTRFEQWTKDIGSELAK